MILCDTAPLVAAIIQSEDSHQACVELFTGLRLARRKLFLPATVVAEVGYMLDALAGPADEAALHERLPTATSSPSISLSPTTRAWLSSSYSTTTSHSARRMPR